MHNQRVLAVDPYDRGFGYALFGGPNDLMDWGITAADRRASTRYMSSLKNLIDRFAPDILITEDGARQGSSRRRETRVLLKRIRRFAREHQLRLRTYSRAAVEDAFALVGASKKKHQIATLIANWFPELLPRLPQPQKPWTGENRSMNVFDAVSFALTFFHQENIYSMTARRSLQPPLSPVGGITGSVSPGNDQDEEDARRLSSAVPAFPSSRPEKFSPINF
ncbi:MAG TPA: hypothetical protein VE422_30690 [Terriglobia bacterium]|nr:hypothetical protein [Terriglobia bacterium]